MKKIYLDLSFGISGDMFLAALACAGVDFGALDQEFAQAGIPVRLDIACKKRNGVQGRSATVHCDHAQPVRTLEQIVPLVERMNLSPRVRQNTILALERLAGVEAQVHGISRDEVHFHELGAVDTLVDIVGAFWGLEYLDAREVISSPMPWFAGHADIEHGTVPLPAPATAVLMQGKMIRPSDFDWEVITPTGALIVDQLVSGFGKGFQGKLIRCGTGFGATDKGFNGLRIFLWEDYPGDMYLQDQVWQLESNIDHLTGEELGAFFQRIMEAGALDVIFLPGIMKKNRPGGQIQVLCTDEQLNTVRHEFFRHTMTLGIRINRVSRNTLPRKEVLISRQGEEIRGKEAVFQGKTLFRPEMDDLIDFGTKISMSPVQIRLSGHKK